jgi:hypothetical protein
VVLGGGGDVRRVRLNAAGSGVESAKLGEVGGGRGDDDGPLVSCSSGGRRSISGSTGRCSWREKEVSGRCGTKRGFGWKSLGAGVAHRRRGRR